MNLDSDLVQFLKAHAEENRTSVTDVITQILLNMKRRAEGEPMETFLYDPLFLETVTIDEDNPMKVFVELDDKECNGVAISRGATGFDVVERHDGESTCRFWYRVVAKRRGFDGRRLEVCGAARNDPYLYPELRRAEPAELDGECESAIAAHRRRQQRTPGRDRDLAHIVEATSGLLGKPATR